MSMKWFRKPWKWLVVKAAGVVVLAAVWSASSAPAQTTPRAPTGSSESLTVSADLAPGSVAKDSAVGGGVVQAGCSTCSGGLLGAAPTFGGGCGTGCGGGCCVPGRLHCCSDCCPSTCIGRLFCGFYECICCPDPCYEPRWIAAANSAFFVDAARPVTQMRLRYDAGLNMIFPDRAEFFWARADGNGKGPRLGNGRPQSRLDYHEITLYNEAAIDRFGLFVELPYRTVLPEFNPSHAGFGDINLGTKSLLLDCELLQVTFQFRTFLPSAVAAKGLGTGHVSLEPSLLLALKLTPDTYFQGQISEWIPLGGDGDWMGAILHYHASINHVLWRPIPDIQLIGTVEYSGWSFQDGRLTLADGGFALAGGESYHSAGSGLRLVFCDKIDFGFGAAFSVSDDHFADQLYRTEFRWRF